MSGHRVSPVGEIGLTGEKIKFNVLRVLRIRFSIWSLKFKIYV